MNQNNKIKKLNYTRSTKRKKRKFSLSSFFFSCFVLYFTYTAFNQYILMYDLDRKIDEKEAIKAELEVKANKLKKDVDRINNEEIPIDLIEELAREQYKMVKPNETIYIDKNKNENKIITGLGAVDNGLTEPSDNENTDTETWTDLLVDLWNEIWHRY